MKFTRSWLHDHLKTDAPIEAIVEAMTMAGLEVEHVDDPAAKLSAFSVARIVSAAPHPNADKLRVCQVETRDGPKEIVCGAPNARAGLVTAYAPIGAYVPGSGITLEPRPVRGVVSNGMLCSGAELELDAEADGILELDPALAVGTPIAAVFGLDDPMIDIEVTPNRPDWLGVEGIARDLAACGLGKRIVKPIKPVAGGFPCPTPIATDPDSGCAVFAARLIRGVKNGPSPAWLQRRLRAIGLKPRSALVDITNFIAIDRCRPLHVYDAATLTGTVRARRGRAGERLEALDGKTYDVEPWMCVIADDARVLGLGGVMGGSYSGAGEATTDVLIESAWFEPSLIYRTGRALGIASDAQARFARGVDPESCSAGLELASQMVLELCGGAASEAVVVGAAPAAPAAVAFDPARVKGLAGLDVPVARVKSILKALGFEAEPGEGKSWRVTPPSFRRDVRMGADLVEEIARVHGFDKLPETEPPRAPGLRAPPVGVGESRLRVARRALAGAGYLEAVTWSFCSRADAALFGLGGNAAAALTLANPIAAELDCMRPTAVANLLRAAQRSLDRGFGDARLFEAGPVYRGAQPGDQRRAVMGVWQPRPARHWRGSDAPDVFDIKRDCLLVLEAVGAPVASLQPGAGAEWMHPGRSGGLRLGAAGVAVFGEVHPRVLQAMDIEGPALAFEIDIDALPQPRAKAGRAKPAFEKRELMPLSRDFAFVVDEAVAAADLVRAAYGAEKALIADVNLFDVYRGPGVPAGKKSLAIEVRLQPREKTLTEAEIEAVAAKVAAAVSKATGGALRA